ncbi:glycosyltransferase family 2 protein [Pantoea sp. Lu_F5_004]|uniref:glycosyltransferase family 2 protein n=1 Tax=Pantoea sp. Lu_F5_004 TaxID=3443507 RepID=UPI003EBF50DA
MLNIVIPMAGRGSRFADAGFTDPKPFIRIGDVPMIELVIRNLRPSRPHRFIFVCQQTHLDRYDFRARLKQLAPGSEVVSTPGLTEGAACSVLMASDFIDSVHPLLIANADQWVDTSIDAFLEAADKHYADGLIMTMPADSPKWSYICRDNEGRVCQVIEKEVVSDEATVGIYFFSHGSDFCRDARSMIEADDRSKGEFYVAPVYSRMYNRGLTAIDTVNIGGGMYGLGTPDDLAAFLASPAMHRARRQVCGAVA